VIICGRREAETGKGMLQLAAGSTVDVGNRRDEIEGAPCKNNLCVSSAQQFHTRCA